ncbi:unnamed protein product [Meganyctiphanes norvegica]|uniref:Uncharacterized protein n=1 Tax=Meganyctiphanes norvegica TaxID=48144 RepID=A0AAV2PQT5_MEGNR
MKTSYINTIIIDIPSGNPLVKVATYGKSRCREPSGDIQSGVSSRELSRLVWPGGWGTVVHYGMPLMNDNSLSRSPDISPICPKKSYPFPNIVKTKKKSIKKHFL